MKRPLIGITITFASLNVHAADVDKCAAFGDKFVEYARDRDAGMSMEAATRKAKAKDGKDGENIVAGAYLNSQMVRMTPNEIRALAVKSCLDQ
jgi:hypothetical protein